MIIRKSAKKKDSIVVGIWASGNAESASNIKFDNGKKSAIFRIPLSEIKNHNHLKSELERFLKEYVKEE